MAAVAARYEDLEELNTEVLAVSVDSHFTHKVWDEEELTKFVDGGIPFPMLADPGGDIGRAYNVYDEDMKVNLRGRFLIDPEGILQASEVLNEPVGRNVDEIIRQVEAFQENAETDEATPEGWTPGDSTLEPGPSLVGRVHEEWGKEE